MVKVEFAVKSFFPICPEIKKMDSWRLIYFSGPRQSEEKTLAPHPSLSSMEGDEDKYVTAQRKDETAQRPSTSLRPSEPRRGLHLQSSLGDNSDNDSDGDETIEESLKTISACKIAHAFSVGKIPLICL